MFPNSRLDLFPLTTDVVDDGLGPILHIGGHNLADLADTYGTPLYLYDQATMDAALCQYRHSLAKHYPAPSSVTYAGKAALLVAIAEWARSRDLRLDCTGIGEIHIARLANVERANILVHGVNKSPADVQMAIDSAGTIVVDNLAELRRLAAFDHTSLPDLWLRVRPGMAVDTHAFTQTGQVDSKFGMDPSEVYEAVTICLEAKLPLNGLHIHQGSHFHDPSPLGPALKTVLDLVVSLRKKYGWHPQHLSPGGGWGVAYHEDELPQPSIDHYVQFVARTLIDGCAARELPLPTLHLEPGRSLVARAGVAIYRVGAIKRTAGRKWALLDGGMTDNIRPALYGARYSALPVRDPQRSFVTSTWLAGPYCESGDLLIEDLPMPDMSEDELVAVPVAGAYQLSMSSNYNGALRPAVVWQADGGAYLVRRRESLEDLVARDLSLPDTVHGQDLSKND
jgi:diaminopimelate decarboxylase